MSSKDLEQCKKTAPPPPGPKSYNLSPPVTGLLQQSMELSQEDRFQLTSELVKTFTTNHEAKKLMNLARGIASKGKNSTEDKTKDEERVCGQQSTVDPGAWNSSFCSTSAPASKVGFICRGDLLAATKLLFFDTEKVVLSQTHQHFSGDLAVVDIHGNLLFWTFINGDAPVCMYNTPLTGLTEDKLQMGLPIEIVKSIMEKMFAGKELWGANSGEDCKSLGYPNKVFPFASATRDIQEFYIDSSKKPISLALLSEHFLGENLQESKHSSITDARLTALCYRKMQKFKNLGMSRFSCPVMDELRLKPKPKQKSLIKYDYCKCGTVTQKKKWNSVDMKARLSSKANFDLSCLDF